MSFCCCGAAAAVVVVVVVVVVIIVVVFAIKGFGGTCSILIPLSCFLDRKR